MSKRKPKAPEGRANEGKTEDSAIVRGPRELLEAYREHSRETGIPLSELLRRALVSFRESW